MRFSNLAAWSLCAVSPVVAAQALAAPPVATATDVRVINTPLPVDVGSATIAVDVINTTPMPVDVGPDAILVDVGNTTPIPVDVGGPLEVEFPVLQVEGPDNPFDATPIHVLDPSVYAAPYNHGVIFTMTTSAPYPPDQDYHLSVPSGSRAVITSINAESECDVPTDARVAVTFKWTDGVSINTIALPLHETTGQYQVGYENVHVVARDNPSVSFDDPTMRVRLLAFGATNPVCRVTVAITGYLVDAP